MRTIQPRHLALLALLATSGCVGIMLPKRRVGDGGDRALPTAIVGSPSIGLSSKEVYGKREPVTLMARDNTHCTVSEAKFRESSIGERVRCDWKAP
jgi:hypothetical protein